MTRSSARFVGRIGSAVLARVLTLGTILTLMSYTIQSLITIIDTVQIFAMMVATAQTFDLLHMYTTGLFMTILQTSRNMQVPVSCPYSRISVVLAIWVLECLSI